MRFPLPNLPQSLDDRRKQIDHLKIKTFYKSKRGQQIRSWTMDTFVDNRYVCGRQIRYC